MQNIVTRSLVIVATGALVIAASACSSKEKAPEASAAPAVAPQITETAVTPEPVVQTPPTLAQNDSKAKGLWGANSTGRSR